MQRLHGRAGTYAQVAVAPRRSAIDIAIGRGIVHIKRIGPIPVVKVRGRLAADAWGGVVQRDFPHGVQGGIVV